MRTLRHLFFVLFLAGVATAQNVNLEWWDFLPDPSASISIEKMPSAKGWRKARAGLSWQAQFDDLRDYAGAAWYRTSIEVPPGEATRRVSLRFGAVDYRAEIFVNGRSIFKHEGGYTPFVVDITGEVHPGANQIAVRVVDPPNKGEAEGMRYREIPHGKQDWYIQTSGLWQPVVLRYHPVASIENIQVTASMDGSVELALDLSAQAGAPESATFTITDRHGAIVGQGEVKFGVQQPIVAHIKIANPDKWSPDDPALYTVEARFGTDTFRTRFGFRRLEARDGKLFLNGKSFYMIGALDQDFYPDTIYSPPSPAYVRREMELAKNLGLNTLRCHIKVCEPEYLDAADEQGIVVWYEIPNWDHFNEESSGRGRSVLLGMIERDWNHPSVLIQSIINESWGIDLRKDEQRTWLAETYALAKKLTAPLGRLIVDNSACCENFHVRTDLDDFHQYYSIPDNAAKWDAWVMDFASRPKWSFSQHGDAQRTGKEPLIVSEFGNWGLPQLPAKLPWWFDRSGQEITRPAGVYERFQQFKFGRLFHDYDDLAQATQWHQFLSLKHEIEEMRRYGAIQGYVITEFTDLNWESNGLLTMWREPKVYAEELARIQRPDVVLAIMPKHNFTAGEIAEAELTLSHYSSRSLKGATLFWRTNIGPSGHVDIGQELEPGSVLALGRIAMPTTSAQQVRAARLYLELRDASARVIAGNQYEFNVFPVRAPLNLDIRLYDQAGRMPGLLNQLTASRYKVSDSAAVMLTTGWDERVDEFVRGGGRALVIADSGDALANLPIQMKERKDAYDGNWVSNFAWIDPHSPVFQSMTFAPILGWEAAAVTPHFVLRGIKPEQYDDVLAGMFYGWINNNSPLLVQARVGKGAVIVTTFRFAEYGVDPYASALLDSLLRYASSPQFQPRMEWAR